MKELPISPCTPKQMETINSSLIQKETGTPSSSANLGNSTTAQKIKNKRALSQRFECKTCNITIYGETNYDQHLAGKRHKTKTCIVEKKKSRLSNSLQPKHNSLSTPPSKTISTNQESHSGKPNHLNEKCISQHVDNYNSSPNEEKRIGKSIMDKPRERTPKRGYLYNYKERSVFTPNRFFPPRRGSPYENYPCFRPDAPKSRWENPYMFAHSDAYQYRHSARNAAPRNYSYVEKEPFGFPKKKFSTPHKGNHTNTASDEGKDRNIEPKVDNFLNWVRYGENQDQHAEVIPVNDEPSKGSKSAIKEPLAKIASRESSSNGDTEKISKISSPHTAGENSINIHGCKLNNINITIQPSEASRMVTVCPSPEKGNNPALSDLPSSDNVSDVEKFLSQIDYDKKKVSRIINNLCSRKDQLILEKLMTEHARKRSCLRSSQQPLVSEVCAKDLPSDIFASILKAMEESDKFSPTNDDRQQKDEVQVTSHPSKDTAVLIPISKESSSLIPNNASSKNSHCKQKEIESPKHFLKRAPDSQNSSLTSSKDQNKKAKEVTQNENIKSKFESGLSQVQSCPFGSSEKNTKKDHAPFHFSHVKPIKPDPGIKSEPPDTANSNVMTTLSSQDNLSFGDCDNVEVPFLPIRIKTEPIVSEAEAFSTAISGIEQEGSGMTVNDGTTPHKSPLENCTIMPEITITKVKSEPVDPILPLIEKSRNSQETPLSSVSTDANNGGLNLQGAASLGNTTNPINIPTQQPSEPQGLPLKSPLQLSGSPTSSNSNATINPLKQASPTSTNVSAATTQGSPSLAPSNFPSFIPLIPFTPRPLLETGSRISKTDGMDRGNIGSTPKETDPPASSQTQPSSSSDQASDLIFQLKEVSLKEEQLKSRANGIYKYIDQLVGLYKDCMDKLKEIREEEATLLERRLSLLETLKNAHKDIPAMDTQSIIDQLFSQRDSKNPSPTRKRKAPSKDGVKNKASKTPPANATPKKPRAPRKKAATNDEQNSNPVKRKKTSPDVSIFLNKKSNAPASNKEQVSTSSNTNSQPKEKLDGSHECIEIADEHFENGQSQENDDAVNPHPDFTSLAAHKSSITCIKVFKGHVYTSSEDTFAKRFSLANPKEEVVYSGHSKKVTCLVPHAGTLGETSLFTAGFDGLFKKFNTNDGTCVNTQNVNAPVLCMASGWNRIFLGLNTGTVAQYDVESDRMLEELNCSAKPLASLVTTTAGAQRLLVTASYDDHVTVWDVNTGLLLRCMSTSVTPPTQLLVQSDKLVMTSGRTKLFCVHNIETGNVLTRQQFAEGCVGLQVLRPNILVTCFADGRLRLNNLDQNYTLFCESFGVDRNGGLTCLAVSGRNIFTANNKGSLGVMNFPEDSPLLLCKVKSCTAKFIHKADLQHHFGEVHLIADIKEDMLNCPWRYCGHVWQKNITLKERRRHVFSHVG